MRLRLQMPKNEEIGLFQRAHSLELQHPQSSAKRGPKGKTEAELVVPVP